MIEIFDANNTFRRDMENTMFSHMSQPRKAYLEAVTSHNHQVYVWDGYNHNARRRKLFDGYKRRPPVAEDIYSGLQLLREILSHTKAVQIEVPEWEADDVIGTLAKHWSGSGHEVRIYTNDLDYFQLNDLPDVKLIGVNNKTGAPAKYLPLYKTMCGDYSDKIPGIPKFGPRTFLTMEHVWDKIIKDFENGDFYSWTGYQGVFLTKPVKAWLEDPENLKLLEAYWKIVHLWDVPLDLIDKHTTKGMPSDEAAQALLRKYML